MANEISMDELLESVEVRNRIVDRRVSITRNAKPVVWEPGEVKRMPRVMAEWFIELKSMYKFYPGNLDDGTPSKRHYLLTIVGDPKYDQTDLTKAEVAGQKELLDVANMPELTRVDAQGNAMRRVYIDPRSTGAMSQSDTESAREKRVISAVSKDIVRAGAEAIADAAQNATVQEIEAAVADLTLTAGK